MAAANFDEALRLVLAHEGGYAHHPSDPGGPTNFGITLAVFRQYVKPNAAASDLRAMSVAQARAIYRAKYWNALACDRLPVGLDYAAFDYGVHSGVARAARVLRHLAGAAAGNGVDAAALSLIAARESRVLIAALCDERLAFLKRLATWAVFGKGWARRVSDVRAAALAMAKRQAEPAANAEPAPTATRGKGVVPLRKSAQRTTTGVVILGGALAAERAHAAGAGLALVLAVVAIGIAVAALVWLLWRWRRRSMQLRVDARMAAVKPEK
jgi:lysozyme family protein